MLQLWQMFKDMALTSFPFVFSNDYLSPTNLLVSEGSVTGLVDWESVDLN